MSAKWGSAIWRGDTLTEIVVVSSTMPSLIQRRSSVSASSNAHAPIVLISPVSSAMGMKSAGGMSVPSSRRHLISASNPLIRPVSISTMGWW